MTSWFRLAVYVLGVLGFGVATAATPASVAIAAQDDFLTNLLLPESQERSLAEKEHPKVLEQFGGEYRDAELSRYVTSLAGFLGQASGRPDIQYRVTILNTPVVNAFALPAGYLYVTRGLLALADSEAELAGVLSHEIGHVTARHTAQRYSRTILAQGIVGLLGAVTQGTSLSNLNSIIEPIAVVALQSFSREKETEADLLGVQTMARAGFDPFAMASFLTKLENKTKLEAQLAGQEAKDGNQFDLFATHPRTAERVESTVSQATGWAVRDPIVERDIYLDKVDGLLYGDDPEQGYVRGRVFAHPKLNFRFEVPEGFTLLNGQREVIARSKEGAIIRFDSEPRRQARSMVDYLTQVWLKDAALEELEPITINGFQAATGRFRLSGNQGKDSDVRLVAIQGPNDTVYRFMFAAPVAVFPKLTQALRRTTYSFRRLSWNERQGLRPYRLTTYRVRQGDTVQSLASRMPFERLREERFRVLNGLRPDERVRSGQVVKLVVES